MDDEGTKRITLRIPKCIYRDVAVRAKEQRRSLNSQIVFELRQLAQRKAA